MRALVIPPEERWIAAVRHLLPADTDLVPSSEQTLLRNPSLGDLTTVIFVCAGDLGSRPIETIKTVRSVASAPIIVFCDRASGEWEEEAIVAGAEHVFTFPVRARLVDLAMRRLLPAKASAPVVRSAAQAVSPAARNETGEALSVLRDVSRSMLQATDGTYFLDALLRKVRELMGCGRLVLYVHDEHSPRNLRCVFVSGADPQIFTSIRLNRNDGAALLAGRLVGVLQRRHLRDDAETEAAARREMDVFGAELCVPLICQEGLVGALFVGRRISGAEYAESELTTLFHLMEELASLIGRHATQAKLAREHKLLSSVVSALPVGCAIINGDLHVVHANPAMHRLLDLAPSDAITFEHLPQTWATAVYGVLQNRHQTTTVEVPHLAGKRTAVVRLRISMVTVDDPVCNSCALLTVEDITSDKHAQKDVTTGAMRALMERAGEQLSNEFRNALTPVSTLLHFSSDNRREMPELSGAVNAGMHRLRRRIDELAYLARRALLPETTSIGEVLNSTRERFEELVDSSALKRVKWPGALSNVEIHADAKALGLAIAELLLNGIEAKPHKPVELIFEIDDSSFRARVINEGQWAPPIESAGFSNQPFVTAKAEGVGIGLEVTSMIAANHGGKVTLRPAGDQQRIEAVLEVPLRSHNPT